MARFQTSSSDLINSDKVQTPAEGPVGELRIKPQIASFRDRRQTARPERITPLHRREIIVWQDHSVWRVADEVHESQRWPGQESLDRMILDHDVSPGNVRRFGQHCRRIDGVM